MIFGIAISKTSIHRKKHKKFKLENADRQNWVEMIDKISEQWRNLLKEDEDTAYPGQWLGFYTKEEEDPVCVFQCEEGFTP